MKDSKHGKLPITSCWSFRMPFSGTLGGLGRKGWSLEVGLSAWEFGSGV